MDETTLRNMPRSLREAFAAESDETYAERPDVVEARAAVDAAEAAHRKQAEEAHRLRTRRAQIEALVANLAERRRELHDTRLRLVADGLLNSELDPLAATDAKLEQQIDSCTLVEQAAPVALHDIDEQLRLVSGRIHGLVRDIETANEILRARIDTHKLAAARAKHA